MIFISIIILRIIVFNVSKDCLINVKDRSFFETSGYRGTRGGRTLRGQFVSGKTVSRSFVYINHGKFRIVGPFTRPSQAPPPLLHLRSSCERVRGSFDFSSRADRLCEGTATRRCCLPLFNSDNNANTPRACNEHPTMLSIDHWSAEEGSEIRCLGQREEETDRRFFPSVERRMEILRPL